MSLKSQQYNRLLASFLPFPTRTGLSTALWVNRYAGAVKRQPVAAHTTYTYTPLRQAVLGHENLHNSQAAWSN